MPTVNKQINDATINIENKLEVSLRVLLQKSECETTVQIQTQVMYLLF